MKQNNILKFRDALSELSDDKNIGKILELDNIDMGTIRNMTRSETEELAKSADIYCNLDKHKEIDYSLLRNTPVITIEEYI